MTAEELDSPSRASAAAAGGGFSGIGRGTADLTELFRQHHLELVRLAALLVRSRETGEDIVQDVFINIHARRAGPPDPARALAYLRRAVVNGCRSWLRRQAVARRLGSADRTAVDVYESAEHAAITAENRRRLQAQLSALPARRREVLVCGITWGFRRQRLPARSGSVREP
jgi:RNA polymerase sigma factor (sigma-70 family)